MLATQSSPLRQGLVLALALLFVSGACTDDAPSAPGPDSGTPDSSRPDAGGPDQGPGPDTGPSGGLPKAGEIIFTELMRDPGQVADAAGEWFELASLAGVERDLDGCEIVSDGDDAHVIRDLQVPAGAIIAIGREADVSLNGGFAADYVQDQIELSNAGDSIAIVCGGVTIDEVTFDAASWPVATGASISLSPDAWSAEANDDPGSWCAGVDAYGEGDLGTPGAANPACSALDPCAPNPCDDPPAAECDGEVATVYGSPGVCSNAGGTAECAYPATSTDCAAEFASTCEAGACVGAPDMPSSAGDVVFTEIMKDPAAVSDDAGEWLELANTTGGELLLAGCTLESQGDDPHTLGAGVVLGPGGYLVLAREGDAAVNGGVAVDYALGASLKLSNSADTLRLSCGGTLIDAVAFDDLGAWPDVPGASISLDPASLDAGANDDPAAWCAGGLAYGAGDLGSPGAANPACPDPCEGVVCDSPPAPACIGNAVQTYDATGACEDGGCTYGVASTTSCAFQVCQGGVCVEGGNLAPAPEAGELVITEIMQNPAAVPDAAGEWFEVVNLTGGDLELSGCRLVSGGAEHVVAAEGSFVVTANEAVVLGVNGTSATNGGVDVDYVFSSVGLANGDDDLAILCGEATLIDAVAWDDGDTFPDPNGASMYLDAGKLTAADNDSGGSWCEGFEPYGDGDLGSPGVINLACPASLCSGVVCDAPPADDCSGNSVQSYGNGVCDPADGQCDYAVVSTADCGGGTCSGGLCVPPSGDPQPGAGDLQITEIFFDASGSDDDKEWFEVYNPTATTWDLGGCTWEDSGGAKESIDVTLTVPAGGYVVLAQSDVAADNGGLPSVDYAYGATPSLGQQAGDSVTISCGGVVVDAVDYTGFVPHPEGASLSLDATGAWCPAVDPYGDGDLGTPGGPNPSCGASGSECDDPPAPTCEGNAVLTFAATGTDTGGKCSYAVIGTTDCGAQVCEMGACIDAADTAFALVGAPLEGDLVITELMKNPAGPPDTDAEWFEVVNLAGLAVELSGCTIVSGGETHIIAASSSLVIEYQETMVFGRNRDVYSNSGVAGVGYEYSSINLGNGDDELTLECGGTILDIVLYTDADYPDDSGVSIQMDEALLFGATQADAATLAGFNDEPSAWCAGTTPFGSDGNFGTPGSDNVSCP